MPWKQRLPVFLYLLTKPTTPEICDIFCLHYRQDESHSSFLERAWETVWTPNPSPHTGRALVHRYNNIPGRTTMHPTAQLPRGSPRPQKGFKVLLCPASTLA